MLRMGQRKKKKTKTRRGEKVRIGGGNVSVTREKPWSGAREKVFLFSLAAAAIGVSWSSEDWSSSRDDGEGILASRESKLGTVFFFLGEERGGRRSGGAGSGVRGEGEKWVLAGKGGWRSRHGPIRECASIKVLVLYKSLR